MQAIFPWQQSQWQRLTARQKNGTLPHAILLAGLQGIGKFIFAQALAEFLLCEQAGDVACGTCKACQLLMAQTHPDLYVLQPEETGKTIKIDQIRSLIESLNKTSQQGRYQVAIIEPAEAMNIAASNALLKTLEEPAGNVALILVSHQPGLLPATIRSRCQIIYFSITAQDNVKKWLSKQVPAEINIELLLSLAEQAPLRAVALANNQYLEQRNHVLKNLIDLQARKIDPVKSATMLTNVDLRQILLTVATILVDLIKIKLIRESRFIANQDKLHELQPLANKISLPKLFDLQKKILELQQLMNKNINLNSALALEDFFIDFMHS